MLREGSTAQLTNAEKISSCVCCDLAQAALSFFICNGTHLLQFQMKWKKTMQLLSIFSWHPHVVIPTV
jgi:hypothetical protein